MTSTGDNEPTLDGAVMLAAAREIVARLDRQLSDIGSEDVKLTPEAGILTGSFLQAYSKWE